MKQCILQVRQIKRVFLKCFYTEVIWNVDNEFIKVDHHYFVKGL